MEIRAVCPESREVSAITKVYDRTVGMLSKLTGFLRQYRFVLESLNFLILVVRH